MTVDVAKPLPHSREAERAILGAIILDNRYLHHVLSRLSEEDFYVEAHRKILRALTELVDGGVEVDTVVLMEKLEKDGLLDSVGGAAYVASLTDGVPEGINIDSYIDIVLEHSLRRQIIERTGKAIEEAWNRYITAEELIERIQEDLIEIAEKKVRPQFEPVKHIGDRTLALVEKLLEERRAITGIPSGYEELDAMTTGFHPGELIIIAGRPGMGKTALALNIALNAAGVRNVAVKNPGEERYHVGIFSLEMSDIQIGLRLLATIAGIDLQLIRKGAFSREEFDKLLDAQVELSKAPIYIDTSSTLNITEMKAKARRLKEEKGLDLLIIDYLQLVRAPGVRERVNEIAAVSRAMKELAKELNIPVIALSQLNRAPETRMRKDHKPQLADLRESGAIEQDADVVAFIYREEVYNKKDPDYQGVAEIILAKQRNGPTGSIFLAFLKNFGAFSTIDPETKAKIIQKEMERSRRVR